MIWNKIFNFFRRKPLDLSLFYDDYEFLNPTEYLKIVEPERQNESNGLYPAFIKFKGKLLNNWIIEISKTEHLRLVTFVHRVPKEVTEKEVEQMIPNLIKIISCIFNRNVL